MTSDSENVPANVSRRNAEPVQFTLVTLLWLTLTIAIALAYLRSFGERACVAGVIAVGLSLGIGALIGGLVRRPVSAVYWSLLEGFFAYLCTQGVAIPHWSGHFAWACAGAAAGACAGVIKGERPLLRMLVGGVAGGAAMAPYVAGYLYWTGESLPDLLVAPVSGALLAAVIEACLWVERRWPLKQARNLFAASLMLLVIAANMVAPRLIVGW
jgi:hypothetical protein